MLKSYLQLLLNLFVKKSETDFIGAQVLPDSWDKKITYYSDYFGDMLVSNTAPTNGWIFVTCGNHIASAYIIDDTTGISTRLQNLSDSMQWPHLYLPVRKGHAWKVVININSGQTEGTTIRFIPSIGG